MHACTVRRTRGVSICFLMSCCIFGVCTGVHSVHAHAVKACISRTCSVHTLLCRIAPPFFQHARRGYVWGVHGEWSCITSIFCETYSVIHHGGCTLCTV